MRNIKIILTNDVANNKFDEQIFDIYRFDKNKDDLEELKKIIIDINKSQNEMVYLITNKKDLFEFFNRNITCEYFDNNGKNSISQREIKININPWFTGIFQNVRDIFFNNINEVLFNYGDIFQIDIEQLVKGTTYNVNNRNDLSNLLVEDLNLINFKGIVTSRLCVIFYRLTYFDLDASKASIGRFFANHFEKSESFKINLNRNPNGWFFTDLNNKIFRGYRIKPLVYNKPDSNLELKIRFAKKLLSKKVNKNIVAESLELTIEEIDYYVYSIQNNKINDEVYNSSIRTMESEYKKIKENKKHAPKQPYTPYMR